MFDHGEVLIAGARAQVVDAIARVESDKLIVDLVRLLSAGDLRANRNYRGIGW